MISTHFLPVFFGTLCGTNQCLVKITPINFSNDSLRFSRKALTTECLSIFTFCLFTPPSPTYKAVGVVHIYYSHNGATMRGDVFVGLVLHTLLVGFSLRVALPHHHNYNTILSGTCQHLFDIFCNSCGFRVAMGRIALAPNLIPRPAARPLSFDFTGYSLFSY